MKLRMFLFLLVLITLLSGCSGDVVSSIGKLTSKSENATDESVHSDGELDILSVLFHSPYLSASNIDVHFESKRTKLIKDMRKALKEEYVGLKEEKGRWFSKNYYALTSGLCEYCYYGKLKDNRPHGFGVLTVNPVKLNDWNTLSSLVYAGNFKNGRFDGYGARFHWSNENETVVVDQMISDRLLDTSRRSLAIAYLGSYVTYDGEWKKGVENGAANYFDIDYRRIVQRPMQDDYWGGSCFPTVSVSHAKKGKETGTAKCYAYGVLVYKGKLKEGERNGKGTMYYLNGQKQYEGEWSKNKYHGKGTMYDEDGNKVYSGSWKNGDYKS